MNVERRARRAGGVSPLSLRTQRAGSVSPLSTRTRRAGGVSPLSLLPSGGLRPPLALALALILLGGRPAAALPPSLNGVGFDQRLDAQVPLELEFKDEAGRSVHLGDYFNDKPVILVLAYFRCPMLCTEVLNGLVLAMLDIQPLAPGKDFRVLTVSFDPRDTPELAAAKRASYLRRYGHAGAEEGWHFLTGQEPAIKRLADAVGFRFRYDAKNDQFAHASGIMVLTPGGKLSRYFYDVKFNPRDVRLGLVEAAGGKIGSKVDQILLFCFHYDPREGKYGLAVMNLVRLGGVLSLLGVLTLFAVLWRRERRRGAGVVPATVEAGGAE